MRSLLAATVLLATCLVASVATAANDKVSANFESLAASGVVGDVTLNPMPDGTIQLSSKLRGLQPGVQYVLQIHDASTSCADGTNTIQVITFVSNPAGNANVKERVTVPVPTIQSIAIREQPANTAVACATLPL